MNAKSWKQSKVRIREPFNGRDWSLADYFEEEAQVFGLCAASFARSEHEDMARLYAQRAVNAYGLMVRS
jgi:hypothetical protein